MNFKEPKPVVTRLNNKKGLFNSNNINGSPRIGESFFHAFGDSTPFATAVFDEKGSQIYVNKAFEKLVGREESELIGKNSPYDFLSVSDSEKLGSAFEQTIHDNMTGNRHDFEFIRKNGEAVHAGVAVSSFISDENERFFRADVIESPLKGKIDNQVNNSQSLLMSVIEGHKDMIIFSTDKEYRYLHFNKAHWDSMKYGYGREIEVGESMLDYITSEDERDLVKDTIDLTLKGESVSFIQTFGNVNVAYYESYFNPIKDEKGEIIGCTVIAKNITSAVHAEKALRDSEIKFKEIINQINDVIIVFDEKAEIIIWNKGAELAFGRKAEEVLHKSIIDIQTEFTPPPNNERRLIEEKINTFIKRKNPGIFNKILNTEIMLPDSGKIRNIQSVVFPITLNGSYLFCTVIRDVTEVKRYEHELLRLSDEKDKFYSMIAQYLYTPFNVFNNFSKLMAEELDNLPIKDIQKMAGMMSKSASNLYNLLDNLLQWTRMKQGKISFQPQNLNLKKASEEAVSILKPAAFSKNFSINHFIEDEVDVYADLYMLKTILRNLVTSAIKFSDGDGQIDIFARQTTSATMVSVFSENINIDTEQFVNLFDKSQTHSVIGAAEEKGTVLGLLLCKEFVEKHGGQISVDNHTGKGIEFQFTLPIT